MATHVRTVFEMPAGYASPTAAWTLWALDDLTRRIVHDTRALTPEALEWQPAPGTNTIGMLLAHIAVAETHLVAVGLERRPDSDVRAVIGISMDDEGMPLAPGAAPAPALAGREVAFFHQLLHRAREHTRAVARTLTDADLAIEVPRPRPDGGTRILDGGWVLYHLVEHTAGHHGQINLLQHLYRVRPGFGPGSGAE
jgi:uncharacterized damage-inducible protein DinB